MIDNVKSGDKLTTELVNDIIDKANGQLIPSTGSFRNEKNGSLFIEDVPFPDQNKFSDAPVFLQCIGFDQLHYKLDDYPFKYKDIPLETNSVYINLGASLDEAKNLLKFNNKAVEEIIVLDKDRDEGIKIEKEWFEPANDDTLSSFIKVNTGFIDIGFGGSIQGGFVGGITESGAILEDKIFYVLTNYSLGSTEQFEKEIFPKIQKYVEGEKGIVFNYVNLFSYTESSPNNETAVVQNIIGGQYITITYPVDSESAGRALSSLEKTSFSLSVETQNPDGSTEVSAGTPEPYYQLFQFNKRDNVIELPSDLSALSNYNLILREYDEELSGMKISYSPLSDMIYQYQGDSQISTLQLSSIIVKTIKLSNDLSGDEQEEKYIQLYGFDEDELTEIDKTKPENYNVVLRVTDDDGTKHIGYVQYTPQTSADSDIGSIEQYSIETKKSDDDEKYFQLYNFDKSTYDVINKENHIVLVKNKEDKTLEYVELSAVTEASVISGDANIENLNQKSIDLVQTEEDGRFYQLYDFDNEEYKSLDLEKHKMLVKNVDDDTLQYADLSALSSAFIKVDSKMESIDQKSIDINDDGYGETYIQLYNFDKEEPNELNTENQLMLVKNKENNTLEYIELSALSSDLSNSLATTGDANIEELERKSIESKTDDDKKYFQLYNFEKDDTVKLSSYHSILVKNKDTNTLEYADPLTLSNTFEVSVDSMVADPEQNSLERIFVDTDNYYLQLYNFEKDDTVSLSSNHSILVKNKDTNTLEYADISSVVISADSNIKDLNQKSVEIKEEDGKKYIQLYKFDDPTTSSIVVYNPLENLFSEDGKPYGLWLPGDIRYLKLPQHNDDKYEFLMRNKETNELEYRTLDLNLPLPPTDSSKTGSATMLPRFYYSLDCINETAGAYDGRGSFMQLHNFSQANSIDSSIDDFQAIDGAKNGFVVRKKGYGNEDYSIEYITPESIEYFVPRNGDVDITENSPIKLRSIDFHPKENSSFGESYYELYNFGNNDHLETANFTLELNGSQWDVLKNTDITEDGDSLPKHYILCKTIDGEGNFKLTYKRLLMTTPDISSMISELTSDYRYDDTEIRELIETNTEHINDLSSSVIILSGDLADLSSELSNFWVKGEGASENYGSSIGDSTQNMVIDLDSRELYNDWTVDNGLRVNTFLNVGLEDDQTETIIKGKSFNTDINGLTRLAGNNVTVETNSSELVLIHPGMTTETVYTDTIKSRGGGNGTNPNQIQSDYIIDVTGGELRKKDDNVRKWLIGGGVEVYGGDIDASSNINCDGTVDANKVTTDLITIGNTTINESQLKQLLALLS